MEMDKAISYFIMGRECNFIAGGEGGARYRCNPDLARMRILYKKYTKFRGPRICILFKEVSCIFFVGPVSELFL